MDFERIPEFFIFYICFIERFFSIKDSLHSIYYIAYIQKYTYYIGLKRVLRCPAVTSIDLQFLIYMY